MENPAPEDAFMASVHGSTGVYQDRGMCEEKRSFRSLARLLDRQMLGEAFRKLKRRASPGIDGVTYDEYAENLEENLLALETRLREGKYRARPVKRRWIAKAGSNKMRPLGIPVLEDKIVQQAVKMILEPIWENDFVDESIGYRPGRGPRLATQELGARLLELLRRDRQLGAQLEVRPPRQAAGPQMAQPAQPAPELHVGQVRRSVAAVANPVAPGHREAVAPLRWTKAASPRMKSSTNRTPIMIEVPPARLPEEPGVPMYRDTPGSARGAPGNRCPYLNSWPVSYAAQQNEEIRDRDNHTPESPELYDRVPCVLAILAGPSPNERHNTLSQCATAAAEAGEVDVVLKAIAAIGAGTADDNLCSVCSEVVAKQGKASDATAVAKQIANDTARNNLLGRIASGDIK